MYDQFHPIHGSAYRFSTAFSLDLLPAARSQNLRPNICFPLVFCSYVCTHVLEIKKVIETIHRRQEREKGLHTEVRVTWVRV